MTSWLVGGGGVLLVALWALWERASRAVAQRQRDHAQREAESLRARVAALDHALKDAVVRREAVIDQLKKEVAALDVAQKPIAGDVVERLRGMFDGSLEATTGVRLEPSTESAAPPRGKRG